MSFLYPTVFWIGLPLITAPLVIHLLNLRRQHRVPWAAMDFLLESQERSKTWINLQELLLLLLRTAAIALLVVMLARPTTRSSWIGRLLNRPVHHLVVLDDSYSTTDRWAETSAWQEGLGATTDILQAAADQSTASMVSVLRFSEAESLEGDDPRPAIFRKRLDAESRQELESRLETAQPTDQDSGLAAALRRVLELAALQPPEEDLVVHVVSDFRQREMSEVEAIQELVETLQQEVVELQFIRTVRQPHENLAVTHLAPASGVRAAGVEMWMELEVQNYGASTARQVVVELEQDGNPLVAVPLGDIPAGEKLDRRFRATLSGAGPHWIAAAIDADAVELDNRRQFATFVPDAQKILLVDGSSEQWESYYVSAALAPGGTTKSGWQPIVSDDRGLNGVGDLTQYAAIALLDAAQLQEEDRKQLEAYVANGGGLFITLGESARRDFYAGEGFRDGSGLVPAPPELPTQWLPETDTSDAPAADIRVTEHPVFSIFRGQRNSMLSLMRINYYYSLSRSWENEQTEDTRVIATLADGSPLVLEKPLGDGKIVMLLTKISPDRGELGSWSNLGPNPAFVVLANELFGYLANGGGADSLLTVGDEVRKFVDRNQFTGEGTIQRISSGVPFQSTMSGDPAAQQLQVSSPPLEKAGLYRVELDRASGGVESRFSAVNPAGGEGDLSLAADTMLRQKFANDQFSLRYADELSSAASPTDSAWTEVLLAALVLALVGEQALAYVCSFHE